MPLQIQGNNIALDPLGDINRFQTQAPAIPTAQGGPGIGQQLAQKATSQLAGDQIAKLGLGAAGTAIGGPVGGALGSAAGELAGPLAGQLIGSLFAQGGSVLGQYKGPKHTGAQKVAAIKAKMKDPSFKLTQADIDELAADGISPEAFLADEAGVRDYFSADDFASRFTPGQNTPGQAGYDTAGRSSGTANIRAPLGQDWTGVLDASGIGEGYGGVDRVGAEYNISPNTSVGAQYTPNNDGYFAGIQHKFNKGGMVGGPLYRQDGGMIPANADPMTSAPANASMGPLSPAKMKMEMDGAKFAATESREDMKFKAEEGRKNEIHAEKLRKMKSPLGE